MCNHEAAASNLVHTICIHDHDVDLRCGFDVWLGHFEEHMKQGKCRTLTAKSKIFQVHTLTQTTAQRLRCVARRCSVVQGFQTDLSSKCGASGCQYAAFSLLHVLLKVPQPHIKTASQIDIVVPSIGHGCVWCAQGCQQQHIHGCTFSEYVAANVQPFALLQVLLKVPHTHTKAQATQSLRHQVVPSCLYGKHM